MAEKKRLDVLLYDMGLAESREKAKALIMSGIVFADGRRADKPGECFPAGVKIEVRGKQMPYVGRGGLKLEKAVETFDISLRDKTAMDIGASTGGFTDCMLQKGAVRVYAVDVGYGQLAWSLRTNKRVVNLERTNIRYLEREAIPEEMDFICIDVSFISLSIVLPAALRFLKPTGEVVCLIKPQFEAGRDKVGKNGVVRDPVVHREVIEKIRTLAEGLHFTIDGLTESPIKGADGNTEFLIYLRSKGE